jgi:hypothetical protein
MIRLLLKAGMNKHRCCRSVEFTDYGAVFL